MNNLMGVQYGSRFSGRNVVENVKSNNFDEFLIFEREHQTDAMVLVTNNQLSQPQIIVSSKLYDCFVASPIEKLSKARKS